MVIKISRRRQAEILRFGLVGLAATAIQYGVYLALINFCSFPAVWSVPVSYGVSFVFNFLMSNLFTFHTRPSRRNAAGFALSHAVNLGLQTLLVALFARMFSPDLALLPAMVICVPVNYLMVRWALNKL